MSVRQQLVPVTRYVTNRITPTAKRTRWPWMLHHTHTRVVVQRHEMRVKLKKKKIKTEPQIRVKSIKTTCHGNMSSYTRSYVPSSDRRTIKRPFFFFFFYFFSSWFFALAFWIHITAEHSSVAVRPRSGDASTRNVITVRHLYGDCDIIHRRWFPHEKPIQGERRYRRDGAPRTCECDARRLRGVEQWICGFASRYTHCCFPVVRADLPVFFCSIDITLYHTRIRYMVPIIITGSKLLSLYVFSGVTVRDSRATTG